MRKRTVALAIAALVFSSPMTSPIAWAAPCSTACNDEIKSCMSQECQGPYFTNGSAPDLDAVLRAARFTPKGFLHEAGAGDAGDRLGDTDRAAVLAFLDLL